MRPISLAKDTFMAWNAFEASFSTQASLPFMWRVGTLCRRSGSRKPARIALHVFEAAFS